MCRLGALQISIIKPLLAANGVNLVAVGLEQLGVEEFIERKFFDGGMLNMALIHNSIIIITDLYIDEIQKSYKDLNYKR